MKFFIHSVLLVLFAAFIFPLKVAAIGTTWLMAVADEAGWPAAPLRLGANTLTSLIPDCYVALDTVSRELTGFLQSCARNTAVDRVALNQTVRAFQTPANTAGKDITPAMSLPSAADQTIANKSVTLTKARAFPFSWTGEEQRSMNAGPGFLTIKQDQIAQAIRAAVNEIETDLATAAKNGASRAYGTPGTTPFGSTLADPAQLRKILDDNGAPASDRGLIIDTAAGANLRTLSQLTKANEAGDVSPLRQGVLLDIHNFAIRESAKIQSTTKGTGTSYVLNGTHAVGATSVVVKTGSGTIVAGDVLTIGSYKYVVTTGVSAPGTVVIGAPGLIAAGADGDTVTVGNTAARNIGMTRNSMVLATRLPAIPEEGDMAIMREIITDPRTLLSFEVAVYPGYRMNLYEIGICWGQTVIKPEHMAVLLG